MWARCSLSRLVFITTINILILQMSKLRHREGRKLSQASQSVSGRARFESRSLINSELWLWRHWPPVNQPSEPKKQTVIIIARGCVVYTSKLKKGFGSWVTLAIESISQVSTTETKERFISTWLHFRFPDTEKAFLFVYFWLGLKQVHKPQYKDIFSGHSIFKSHFSLELRISLILL